MRQWLTCGPRQLSGGASQEQAGSEPLDLLIVVRAVQVARLRAVLADRLGKEFFQEASHGYHATCTAPTA